MIELIRFRQDDGGTFGALVVPGFGSLVTVERQWLDRDEQGKHWPYGVDNRSCVPAGSYTLTHEHSNRYGRRMWHIVGEGVTYQPRSGDPVEYRSNCMFHSANVPHELQGCIAPGMIYMPTSNRVGSSVTALGHLSLWLGQIKSPQLRIRNAF